MWLAGLLLVGLADGLLLEASFDGPRPITGPALSDTPTDELRLVAGRVGQALAPGQRLSLRLDRPLPAAGTIALWLAPTFGPDEAVAHAFWLVPPAAGHPTPADNWHMQWLPDGRLLTRAGAPTTAEVHLAGLRFQPGQWLHLALAWDTRSLTVYVDGRPAVTVVGAAATPPGDRLHLGGWSNGERLAAAALDEFRLYNRKLSPSDLAALAGGADGAALGPEPAATREDVLPLQPPPNFGDESLLLRLDGERWPINWLRPVGPADGVRPAPGRWGQGLRFVRGGLKFALDGRLPADRGTFACWLKPDGEPAAPGSRVLFHLPCRGAPVTDNYHLQFYGGQLSGRAGAMPAADTPGAGLTSGVNRTWPAGEWRHLAWVWSPAAVRLFSDGRLAGEATEVAYPRQPADTLTLGCWADGSRAAEATLDDIHLFARDLSAAEIAALAR